ncbi:MAG TPA: response regulator transcription factor, partial [Egibacteraceae bacterium]|nr:response regulator transcription factor [Egibacteraceae bacterium]
VLRRGRVRPCRRNVDGPGAYHLAMTRNARVLVVEDDVEIAGALRRSLALAGYDVELAGDGVEALSEADTFEPDAVVLDLGLPKLDGVEVCRRLREQGDVPILVLTARDAVESRVEGLDSGADDYLIKPFALAELVARLHALLRRRGDPLPVPLHVGDIHVDPARRVARRGDRQLGLTRREFDLLETFARHAGIVLTRPQLLSQVWGYDFAVDGNVVDVFVGYLRRKLEEHGEPRLLHTVRGVGFVLRP